METDRESALAAGCDDFETKPVVVARLVGKIETLLRAHERLQGPAAGPASPAKEGE
jgi:DNA-binding response OmpR family regulator